MISSFNRKSSLHLWCFRLSCESIGSRRQRNEWHEERHQHQHPEPGEGREKGQQGKIGRRRDCSALGSNQIPDANSMDVHWRVRAERGHTFRISKRRSSAVIFALPWGWLAAKDVCWFSMHRAASAAILSKTGHRGESERGRESESESGTQREIRGGRESRSLLDGTIQSLATHLSTPRHPRSPGAAPSRLRIRTSSGGLQNRKGKSARSGPSLAWRDDGIETVASDLVASLPQALRGGLRFRGSFTYGTC